MKPEKEASAARELSATFTEIYEKNLWGDDQSASGVGSRKEGAAVISTIEALRLICQKYNILSISDIPCGDFNWMPSFLSEFPQVRYTGFDVVKAIIERNQSLHPQFSFELLDITSESPPKADLILCKDLLNHLTYAHIQQAIVNMKLSGSTYLLASNNFGWENQDLARSGGSRHLDLLAAPFNFQRPIWDNIHYLGLWKLADLKP